MIAYELETIVVLARARAPYYRALYAGLPEERLDPDRFCRRSRASPSGTRRRPARADRPDDRRHGVQERRHHRQAQIFHLPPSEWDSLCEGLAGHGSRAGYGLATVGHLFYAGDLYAPRPVHHHSLERCGYRWCTSRCWTGGRRYAAPYRRPFRGGNLAGVPTTCWAGPPPWRMKASRCPRCGASCFGGRNALSDQAATLPAGVSQRSYCLRRYASVDAGPGAMPSRLAAGTNIGVRLGDRSWKSSRGQRRVDRRTGPAPGKVLITNLTRLLMPIIRIPRASRAEWVEADEPGPQIPPAGPFRGRGARRRGVAVLRGRTLRAGAFTQTELTASGFQLLIRHHDRRTN